MASNKVWVNQRVEIRAVLYSFDMLDFAETLCTMIIPIFLSVLPKKPIYYHTYRNNRLSLSKTLSDWAIDNNNSIFYCYDSVKSRVPRSTLHSTDSINNTGREFGIIRILALSVDPPVQCVCCDVQCKLKAAAAIHLASARRLMGYSLPAQCGWYAVLCKRTVADAMYFARVGNPGFCI